MAFAHIGKFFITDVVEATVKDSPINKVMFGERMIDDWFGEYAIDDEFGGICVVVCWRRADGWRRGGVICINCQ